MSDGSKIEALIAKAVEQHKQGRLENALTLYNAVIRLNASIALVYCNRGVALNSLQRFEEGLQSCEQAIRLKPDYAQAYYNQGNALKALRRLAEAVQSYDRAIALKPDNSEAYNNRGNALYHLNRLEEALRSYELAIALNPDNVATYNNKASALQGLNRFDEALQNSDRAIELKPDFAEAYYTRGNALQALKRFDEALKSADQVIKLKPGFAEAYFVRGNALRDMKNLEAALESYDKATTLKPDYPELSTNKSQCLLALGRFEEGFRLYEHRKRIRSKMQNYPSYDRPLWLGNQSLAGKTLLISPEMLLGDMIQFSRYAKLAEAQGAKVILSAANSLRRLLGSLSPTIQIIAENTEPSSFDFHCPLMSLPLAFKTTLENIPAQVPYLHAEPGRIERWKERIGSQGFKIGICWQGSTTAVAAGRSFPLVELEGLSGIPHVRLISLQIKDGVEQLENLPAGMAVETLGEDFDAGPDAFVDAAAVMENLDLIITSDTAIAHLAGALARPTWVALKYVPDWRWLLERSDSPWYPTVRLFRQQSQDDWKSVFVEMEAKLLKLVGSTSR